MLFPDSNGFTMRLLSIPSGLSFLLLGSVLVAMAQVVPPGNEPSTQPVMAETPELQSVPLAQSAPAEQSAPAGVQVPKSQPVPPESSAPLLQSEPLAQSAPAEQSTPVAPVPPVDQSAPGMPVEFLAQSAALAQSDPTAQSGPANSPTEASAPAPDAVAPAAAEQSTQIEHVAHPADVVPVPEPTPLALPQPVPPPQTPARTTPPALLPRPPVVKPPVAEIRPPESPPKLSPISRAAVSSEHAAKPATAAAEIPAGAPGWVRGCKALQMQGSVLMCDADTLLAMPSDKVQVYVRSETLITREGRFTVRESLPMRYRFFVLQ